MSEALITSEILVWARERAQLTIQEFSKKISQTADKVSLWESGVSKPTFLQAQKIARVLHIPFGYLFLNKPPVDEKIIPDLRTLNNLNVNEFSIDLNEVLKDVQRKQDWYRDYLKDNGSLELPFIGRFTTSSSIAEIVEDINDVLGLQFVDRKKVNNWEAFLMLLIKKAEDAGIWVIRNSKVGNNTRRGLSVEEFRGFTLCDSYAPLVYINSADAKAAQIFTLFHEIAHLWLGESGISDVGLTTDCKYIGNDIEHMCDQIAAEILVPASEFKSKWLLECSITENIVNNASFFKVSKVVAARRALDLDLILKDEFFEFYSRQKAIWEMKKKKQQESAGGPSFYKLLPITNGRKFTEAVLVSILTQKTLVRYGARLLGVKPDKIDKVVNEVGMS